MEVTPHPWFIDAWAVHDGRVFASRRPPDTIDAATTVFMSVPDLEAVPVGRISTALRATRSGFQDRFRDAAGAEIPFPTLIQVRDIVRRAYLAASLGPGAPGALGAPIPAPIEPAGSGSAYLVSVLDRFEHWRTDGPPGVDTATPPFLDEALVVFAQATLLEWDRVLSHGDPDLLRAFMGWTCVVSRCGAFATDPTASREASDLHSLASFADLHGAFAVVDACRVLSEAIPTHWTFDPELSATRWFRGHMANVPLPTIPRWDARLTRLVEMHTLPIVDRRFWSRCSVIDIAPLILVALTRRLPVLGQLPGEQSPAESAFRELTRSLRWEPLPDAAETALERFIDHCLDSRPPVGTPPSATPAPVAREHAHPDDGEVRTSSGAHDAPKWAQSGRESEPPTAMALA